MIRDQRSEGAIALKSGAATPILKHTGPSAFDRVIAYRLDDATDATALITLTQRGKFDEVTIVNVAVATRGAGRLRVHGSVEVSAVSSGDTVLHFCVLEAGSVEPVPPIDVAETRDGNGIAGPGVWSDVGAGWCPAERYMLSLSTSDVTEFQFVDRAGAQFAFWSVTGQSFAVLHPPRMRLQARCPTAGVVGRGFCAAWR